MPGALLERVPSWLRTIAEIDENHLRTLQDIDGGTSFICEGSSNQAKSFAAPPLTDGRARTIGFRTRRNKDLVGRGTYLSGIARAGDILDR